MEELDLKEIFNIFWTRKIQISFILLFFLGIGCIYTLKYTKPIYGSSITLGLVSNQYDKNTTITTNDITLNSKLIATYNKLIKSSTVLKEVISNLDIKISEQELKKNVSVSSINNTELISITVKNENNYLAATIANEIAEVFEEKVKEMYNINNIKIISEANVEDNPLNINHKKDVIMFLGIGIVIVVAYVTLANMLDTTIKTPEDIEKEFNLPVLASVPILRKEKYYT